jgi:single-stranded-DNA-specific exonuclease
MNYSIRRQLSNEEQTKLAAFSPLLAHLLFHRGISDNESAKKFLEPDYDRDTHDPFLLKDADKAAGRIIQAMQSNEKIAIYSDYDADGIPGAVIFNDLFNRIGFKNFSIYIPHRHDEGFGVNTEAVEQLASEGVKLLITIDCGISDAVAIEYAQNKGIDVIITDHHEPPEELPEAFAIIDHKQADCRYPDKNICGAAVAYKLIQAVLAKNRFGLKDGQEKWFLDMVGIATLSDMVPLVGENRVLARYGMAVLRKSPRKGLMRLLEKLKVNQKNLTEDDISFMITPRINAASRMGAPMDAFSLLSAQDDETARHYADRLDKMNNERKGVVASLVREVKKTIRERYGNVLSSRPAGATDIEINSLPNVIVLGNPAWRPSLLGLVANTCAQEFNRPIFLWGRDGDNIIKGSCRSEGNTHIVELMRAVPAGVFTQMGGHRHSGGFAVNNNQIHFLEQRLNEAFGQVQNSNLKSQNEIQKDNLIDSELLLDSVNSELHDDIAKLSPFGVGNPKPVFLFKNIIPASVRRFGKGNDHIELIFKKQNGEKVSAISFFGAENEWTKNLAANKAIDLIASIEKSMYMDTTKLRLRIVQVISD